MSDLIKKIAIVILILLIVVASFVYYNNYKAIYGTNGTVVTLSRMDSIISVADAGSQNEESESDMPIETAENQSSTIKVHVAGAVKAPGMYEAPADSRVSDLIALAGGQAEDADLDMINLAARVSDAQKVYIPSFSDTEAETVDYSAEDNSANYSAENYSANYSAEDSNITYDTYVSGATEESTNNQNSPKLVNINTATAGELKTLPGIGDALSAAIISHREYYGDFKRISDVMNVTGIGEKRYEQIKNLITVGV